MRIAVLITAYNLPSQLDLLIKRLCRDFDVFLYTDERFTYGTQHPRLYRSTKSLHSEWGSYEQILSIIDLYKAAQGRGHYDRYLLISGQDVPCVSNAEIISFFGARPRTEFIHGWDVKEDAWNGDGRDRLRLFWFTYDKYLSKNRALRALLKLKRRTKHLFQLAIHGCQRAFGLFRPFEFPMYVGENWMDLTGECVDYMLKYIEDNPGYLPRFKHTLCGVEVFFHSIIFNSPFREYVEQNCNRYTDHISGPERPRVLRSGDENTIRSSGRLFARKFDERIDGEIVKSLYALTEASDIDNAIDMA